MSKRDDIWALADALEQDGRPLHAGRPKHRQKGHLVLIAEKLGVSVRTVSWALQQRKIARLKALAPTSPSVSQDLGPRTEHQAVQDLQRSLDRFIDDFIEFGAGKFNPAVVMWVEKGIELLNQPWEP